MRLQRILCRLPRQALLHFTSVIGMQVQQLSLDDIMPLRVAVLRVNTPSATAHYAEDTDPTTVHFGIRKDGVVVACSTWITRPFPTIATSSIGTNKPATQLKGMAVAHHLQSQGLGAIILSAGVAHAVAQSTHIVWARARDSAIAFYQRNGFVVVGDVFMDDATAMPHHLVKLDLASP